MLKSRKQNPPAPGVHHTHYGDATVIYAIWGMLPDMIELCLITVPEKLRRGGVAKAAMQAFLADVDQLEFSCILTAMPQDEKTDLHKLVGWYRSLGFEATGMTKHDVTMHRPARRG